MLELGPTRPPAALLPAVGRAATGVEPPNWSPPRWLYPHQRPAALRLAAALEVFGGALLADAVGLGKTYVALALATRAGSAVGVVPATLREQWRRAAGRLGLTLPLVTHEALSRRGRVPRAALVIVDEAHRFRNPTTRRYDRLARDLLGARLLLVTATPVVNGAADLHHLLRLFLPDNALAILGVGSLERALRSGRFHEVLHASAPLIVARTEATARGLPGTLPVIADGEVVRAPPIAKRTLSRVISAVDRLRFPGFSDEAPQLLRLHLLHRLASSAEAASETLRRHRAYCARARDAALRGECLARGVARRLFGDDDDGQMELVLRYDTQPAAHPDAFDEETKRLDAVLMHLTAKGTRPKEDAFRAVVRRREHHKTLVFTVARATAHRLADVLAWRRVAVVTGTGARIASGRVVAEEVFALFAPAAHHRPPPSPTLSLDVLIATDLASEGLDLQDADAVVHYDLPWTPVRLAQRVGRIARLGSVHREVEVCWFVPPRPLEQRLALTRRLRTKIDTQLDLAVPSSSMVGRARVASAALDARERIALHAAAVPIASGGRASVTGSMNIFAVRWVAGSKAVHELIGLTDQGIVLDPAALEPILLSGEAARSHTNAARAVASLAGVVRQRLAAAHAGPTDLTSRRLARRILRRGRTAAQARRPELLELLDRALARVQAGVTIGEERALQTVLATRNCTSVLRTWIAAAPLRCVDWDACRVEAAMLTTGPISDVPSD